MAPRPSGQRPSWQSNADPHFFRVILKENIQDKNLMLPMKFSRKYHNELSDIAQLTVSDGQVWKVGLERQMDGIFLNNGFHEFAQHYSLTDGYWLIFKYKGMSRFTVHIYDMSSCEIAYPSRDPKDGKEKNDVVRSCDSAASRRKIPHPNTVTGREKRHCKYMSRSGIPTPRHFKSQTPHFETKLKKYNFHLNIVYIPSKVSKSIREAQRKEQSIKLDVGDGREWNVSLLKRKTGRLSLGKLKAFYEENNLKETDICIFELVKKNILKVFIFTAL